MQARIAFISSFFAGLMSGSFLFSERQLTVKEASRRLAESRFVHSLFAAKVPTMSQNLAGNTAIFQAVAASAVVVSLLAAALYLFRKAQFTFFNHRLQGSI
jgi:hypothetical protein